MATKAKTTAAAKKTTKPVAKKAPAKTTAKKAPAKKTVRKTKKSVSFEDIQLRAYEIYQSNGYESSAEENWLQAEKELVG